jgi:hypothetical protein
MNLVGTTSNTSFTWPVTFGRRHHSPPYNTLYASPQGLHPNGIFLESPKIGTLVVMKHWMLISLSNQVCFEHMRAISYSPYKNISSGVSYTPIKDDLTPILRGFVVGSKILNLIPNLFLGHNSCILGLNEQCKGTLGF